VGVKLAGGDGMERDLLDLLYRNYTVSQKNKQNYFCYNYVKLPKKRRCSKLSHNAVGLIVTIRLLTIASSIRQKAPHDLIILWFK